MTKINKRINKILKETNIPREFYEQHRKEMDTLYHNGYDNGYSDCQEENNIVINCCECGGECELNTEYTGSAVCKDKNCRVHKIY